MTKIIANRLKLVLLRLILENQGGFLKKRYILDTIILVEEFIHSSEEEGKLGFVIKFDMVNAFD